MKIIHFSDIHIHDQLILGQNSTERFQTALKHVYDNHLDANLFVISGDLTHHGRLQSYKKLKEILDKANLPLHLLPKLILPSNPL